MHAVLFQNATEKFISNKNSKSLILIAPESNEFTTMVCVCVSGSGPVFVQLCQYCCRKADPFQGPKLGSCLMVGNELSEETHVLTEQETLLGKGTRVESSRVREPKRTALPHGPQCWVLW